MVEGREEVQVTHQVGIEVVPEDTHLVEQIEEVPEDTHLAEVIEVVQEDTHLVGVIEEALEDIQVVLIEVGTHLEIQLL